MSAAGTVDGAPGGAPALGTPRWWVPLTLGGWALFTAWQVRGFPAAVDLPVHGAILQTLVELLKGDPAASEVYQVHFQVGYGLAYWLFLPLAWVTSGGVAIRVALWVALQLFPWSVLALLRSFGRSSWALVAGLPLAFNISYWYGLLASLLAQSLAFFAIAVGRRALDRPRPRTLLALNLLTTATLLCHILIFLALVPMLAAMALVRPDRSKALLRVGLAMVLPALLALPMALELAQRAVTRGPWPATQYDALSHLNWFFRWRTPEGLLSVWGPLLICALTVVFYLGRRREEPREPWALFLAACAVYLVTPKTLSGIFLISVRLPVLAAVMALLLVDTAALPRPARVVAAVLCLWSLAETAGFNARFKRELEGLDVLIASRPAGRHGYLALHGGRLLGSRHIYAEHLGEWLTADGGGVGHDFDAGAPHLPVRFKPRQALPAKVLEASPEQLAWFEQILVFGDGDLPPVLAGWTVADRAGHWRRLVKP